MAKKVIVGFYLILLSVIFALPMIRSGLTYPEGIGFWGPNGHDGIWHLSLINHIKSPFNIPMPAFSGSTLSNYHPFYDILVAAISFITRIPTPLLLFQIFPLLMSFSLVSLSFIFARRLFRSQLAAFLLPFLIVFTNSLGFIVTLLKDGTIGGESLFWAMQSPSTMLNPPYALSLIYILLLLILISSSRLTKLKLFFIFLILVLTPITKAYASVIVFPIFSVFCIKQFFVHRDNRPLITLVLSLPVSFLLYFIYNKSASSLFTYQPLWFVNSMIDSPDRFFMPKFSSARSTFESLPYFNFKLIPIYLLTVSIFLIGNFSFRTLGIFKLRLPSDFLNYLTTPIIICICLPLFFTQKGTSWNTIQFLYYAIFLSNIFLVNFLIKVRQQSIRTFLCSTIIILSLIASAPAYISYLSPYAPTYIYPKEVEALSFLALQPKGTVLTYPYDQYSKKLLGLGDKIPIWAYETTSYVAAYSKKPVYLEDEMNLNNSGFNWQERRLNSNEFFKQSSEYSDRGFLVNNKIDYIYLVGPQINNISLNTDKMSLIQVFDNQEVRIYRVQR